MITTPTNHSNDIVPSLLLVTADHDNLRIDQYLTQQLPTYSRTFWQNCIRTGCITINTQLIQKANSFVKQGDQVGIILRTQQPLPPSTPLPASLPITIVHEHPHFLIINKPAGLLIHPLDQQPTYQPTLLDWIGLHYPNDAARVGPLDRPGIVHRLDRYTSGLLIIARTPHAHAVFHTLFAERTITKEYRAIVVGHPPKTGVIDFPIARHAKRRTTMVAVTPTTQHTICAGTVRPAQTAYSVTHYGNKYALLTLHPHTGRTHQIRVHCAAIGHPLLGDMVYGTLSPLLDHYALHAYSLAFTFDNTPFSFTQEPPQPFMDIAHTVRHCTD